MMIHPLVTQLQFARSEFARCFDKLTPEDACRRVEPMNCLSWTVGHLAAQEQFYWVQLAQGREVVAGLRDRVGYGRPASVPPWDEMWTSWQTITAAADVYLNGLKGEDLATRFAWRGKPVDEDVGHLLLRNTFHYWFHLGKAHAIRQMLGHADLPVYVGGELQQKVALGA